MQSVVFICAIYIDCLCYILLSCMLNWLFETALMRLSNCETIYLKNDNR